MAEEILLELSEIIARHPWWRARARLCLALLERLGIRPPASVLDAGCGWGVTLDALEQRGYRATGMDVSRRALERLDRPGRLLIEADLSTPLSHRRERFDAVLALDVIEHIDDDRAALAEAAQLVQPGGALVVSVPALPELFTEFDSVQGHRRRYLPATLRSAFEGTGCEVEQLFWWGQWMVPVVTAQRKRVVSRPSEQASEVYRRYLQLPPWPLPWVMRLMFAIEQPRALHGRLRTGTSLWGVARACAT
jgi:SAM-dependent methyltransferase